MVVTGADVEAVRLLSAWRVAVRDLQAEVDTVTTFGPATVRNVEARSQRLDLLHAEVARTWGQWRSHGRPAASPETLAAVADLGKWRRSRGGVADL